MRKSQQEVTSSSAVAARNKDGVDNSQIKKNHDAVKLLWGWRTDDEHEQLHYAQARSRPC